MLDILTAWGRAVSDRRKNQRIKARGDSYVKIGRTMFPLADYSETGFLCWPYKGILTAGQTASATIHIRDRDDPDMPLTIPIRIRLLRVGGGMVAGQWYKMSQNQWQAFRAYLERRRAKAKGRA